MEVTFFENQEQFRAWLQEYHQTATEIIVGYYKAGANKKGMTWSESVDQALCYGWIDGIRRKINDESYCNRFTPRRPNSIWSNVNIQKVENLKQQGLMTSAGISAYEKRKAEKSGIYSFENEARFLPKQMEETFKTNIEAWDFFNKQGKSYQKTLINWLLSAKREETQQSRLEHLIKSCENKIKLR